MLGNARLSAKYEPLPGQGAMVQHLSRGRWIGMNAEEYFPNGEQQRIDAGRFFDLGPVRCCVRGTIGGRFDLLLLLLRKNIVLALQKA